MPLIQICAAPLVALSSSIAVQIGGCLRAVPGGRRGARGEGSCAEPRGLGKHRGRCVVVEETAGLVLPQAVASGRSALTVAGSKWCVMAVQQATVF